MKIAVFGYYNALNAGDDRIQYCITRLLQGHTVIFLPHYLPPPKNFLQTFDWILIGGGGLVFERIGIWRNIKSWLRHCNAKIGVLGLGVNHTTPELLVELEALIEHCDFFYVRDQLSKALLNHHSKVEVYPDLTWCYPLQCENIGLANGLALNLLPCHWNPYNPKEWVNELSDQTVHPFPFHFGHYQDFDLLKEFFGESVTQEFSLQPLLKSNILIACRFHAIVFAMQLRKPFVAINYDDKVRRLLDESNLETLGLETTEHYHLKEKLNYIASNWADICTRIDHFSSHNEKGAQLLINSVQTHLAISQKQDLSRPSLLKRATNKLLRRQKLLCL